MNHPQIIKEEKLKVVENIFKGRVSDDLMGFLETVIEKGRQKELPKILDYFVNRVKEYKKIGIVTVTSAVELSVEQKAHTEAKLLETTAFVSLEVTYSVEPAILGGLVIRIGDRCGGQQHQDKTRGDPERLNEAAAGVIPADPGLETAVRQQK